MHLVGKLLYSPAYLNTVLLRVVEIERATCYEHAAHTGTGIEQGECLTVKSRLADQQSWGAIIKTFDQFANSETEIKWDKNRANRRRCEIALEAHIRIETKIGDSITALDARLRKHTRLGAAA